MYIRLHGSYHTALGWSTTEVTDNFHATGNGSHIFSIEPLSKTGYLQGLCHGRIHLHGRTRAVMSATREL